MANHATEQASRFHFVTDLLTKQYLKNDVIAGLTTAVVGVSSSMAYAAIAGVNPIFGLFSAIIPTIVGGLFGASNYLVTGPTNATALVTASILIGLNIPPERYLDAVFLLCILSGVVRLFLGLLKTGKILRFVSNAVLTGFISAVGLLIVVGQLGSIFGLDIPRNGGLISAIGSLYQNVSRVNYYVLGVAVATILLNILIRRINKKLPAAFVAIVLMSILVVVFDLEKFGVRQVVDLGLPESIHLRFYLPAFSLQDVTNLLPGAIALGLFTLVEGVSTAKTFAVFDNDVLDSSKEFVSQGIAAIVGGFFRAIPPSGSPSRTSVNYSSGAKTRRAAIFSGIFLYVILILFSSLFRFIALPSLAATVALSGFSLLNFNHISMTWRTRKTTRLVLLSSFFITLFLPLHYSIYIGVGLSILLVVLENDQARLSTLFLLNDGRVVEQLFEMADQQKIYNEIEIVNVNGDLVFGVIEDFEENIRHILSQDIKVLIIRLRWVHLLGSTGIIALIGLLRQAQMKKVKVIFVGVEPELFSVMQQAGIVDIVGEKSIIRATPVVYESLRKGIGIAQSLIKQ
jgi:SulP family sulfate permease